MSVMITHDLMFARAMQIKDIADNLTETCHILRQIDDTTHSLGMMTAEGVERHEVVFEAEALQIFAKALKMQSLQDYTRMARILEINQDYEEAQDDYED